MTTRGYFTCQIALCHGPKITADSGLHVLFVWVKNILVWITREELANLIWSDQ